MLVPAADAIERPGKALDDKTNMSFESRLVRKIKTQCNDFYSYQGIFVATPSGLLLAGPHHDAHDARKVEKPLRERLEKWKTTSPSDRLMTKEVFFKAVAELAKEETRKRYPAGGLVLSVNCRDLPRPEAKTFLRCIVRCTTKITLGSANPRLGPSCRNSRSRAPSGKLNATSWKGWLAFTSSISCEATRRPSHRRRWSADLTAEVIDVNDNLVLLALQEGWTRHSETPKTRR